MIVFGEWPGGRTTEKILEIRPRFLRSFENTLFLSRATSAVGQAEKVLPISHVIADPRRHYPSLAAAARQIVKSHGEAVGQ